MATEKYVSQANFEHVWSNLSAMLDKKVSTNDSRLSDARVPRAHTHGNISNVGTITNNAVSVASGDSLLVGDASANNTIVKSSITFGNGSTFLRNDGTWATPTNTTYSDMKGATASAAGAHGLVPAPTAGAQTKYLRGDGTWQTPPDTNTTYNVFTGASSTTDGSTGLVPKPVKGDRGKYLRADGVWASPANTDTKVTTTLAPTTKAYISGTTNPATSTGTLVFDTGVYLDTTAGMLTATTFKGALSGNADSSTKATNDSLNNPITDYVKSLSVNGRTITITKGDGTTSTITTQDNDHVYNDFTGATSTAGGKNGLVPAPAVGQQGKFLKADGTWATPTDTNNKVTNTLNTAAKAYLTGTTSSTTNTGTQVFDTGVYLTENPGELHADKFVGAVSGNAETATSATKATNDAKNQAITGYIRGLSVSGRTITYTKGDGTTGTITTQDTDTTYKVFTKATTDTAGSTGLVPAPAKGAQAKFLRGDGTWQVPINTWRGIQDNLTSTATDQSLSANQGKVLKGLVDSKVNNTEAGANGLLSKLTTSWSDIPTDNTYFVRQDTAGGNTFGRVKFSTLWTYIKSKGDSAYQAKGNYAASSHTHKYASGFSVSGTTVTVSYGDGTSSTFKTQDTNTTYTDMKGATADTAGTHGLVPAPAAGDQIKYLQANGTWTTPHDTTYDNFGGSTASAGGSAGLVPGPDANVLNQYLKSTGAWGQVAWSEISGKPSTFAPSSHTHNYAGSASAGGSANSAVKLDTATAGSTTQPVYFSGGKPVAIGYTIQSNVPANAKFTDTTYSVFKAATASADGGKGLVPAPAKGQQGYYLAGDSTWKAFSKSTVGLGNVDNTADSAKSVKYATSAGSATNDAKSQAITGYIRGLSVSGRTITYTKGDGTTGTITTQDTDTTYSDMTGATSSAAGTHGLVPAPAAGAQAKFLRGDGTWQVPANTWRGIQDNLTSTSTDQSLSANQGKVLKGLVDGKVENTEDGANGLLSKLTTTWSDTPNDDTYFVRQDTSGGNTFGRVKFSTLWTYIKSKGDSAYQAKGSYAAASHTHKYAGSASVGGSANSAVKLDTATAGSANQPVYFSGGKPVAIGHTIQSNVPANAKFTDTTYNDATQSTHGLMSANDKKKVDGMWDIVSISKSLTLKTDWQDTGIAGNNLTSGTYIIQVSGMTTNSTGFYQEVYSGIMTWFADMTNSTTADEIPLHNAGHADNGNEIYLRTIRSSTGSDNSGRLKLQIAAKAAGTKADTIIFKFRRMI